MAVTILGQRYIPSPLILNFERTALHLQPAYLRNSNSVSEWRNLWNPVVLLGGAGTIGVIAAQWPGARRGVAPWCLIAILLTMTSWPESANDDVSRGVFAISIVWGLLLTVAQWPSRGIERQSTFALPLHLVLLAGLCLTAAAGDVVTLFMGLQLVAIGTSVTSLSLPRIGGKGTGSEPNEALGPLSLTLSPDAGARGPDNESAAAQQLDSQQLNSQRLGSLRLGSLRLNMLMAALLLLGLLLLAAVTGSTRVETIAEALRTSYVNHHDTARSAIAGGGSRLLTLSIAFVGTALAGYAFAVPFHSPGVAAVESAPLSTAASMLLLPRAAALLVWLRLWPDTLTSSEPTAQLLAGVLAGITLVVPLLQARVAHDLVRQWTLLAMAQGGWLLLAIAAWSFGRKTAAPSEAWPVVEWNLPNAAQGAWLFLLLDGVAVIGLFGVLAYLHRRERPVKFVADLQGLWRNEPLAAGCASICLLSLTGAPLLAGFWSRLFVVLAAMNVRGEWGPPQMLVPHIGLMVLTAVAALSTVWSASVAGRSLWTMFFGLPLGQPRPAGSISSLFVAVLAALMLLGCGLVPGPLLSWLCAPVE